MEYESLGRNTLFMIFLFLAIASWIVQITLWNRKAIIPYSLILLTSAMTCGCVALRIF